MNMKRRVVVTGLGVVSSIGIGKDEFWKNLIAGKSGISEITAFDTSDYPVHKGGEVKNFDPAQFIPKNRLKGIARASQFAIAATKMAFDDAGLKASEVNKKKTGVLIGTTMADVQSLEQIDKYWVKNNEKEVWAINVKKYPANNLSNQIGFHFNFSGLNYTIPTACSAGNYSIGLAFDLIRNGKIDMAIVGGADPIARTTFTGFNRIVAMAPEKCMPFDKNRKGMMIGEGAGILILESLEFAKRRKANIYAEVLGYGLGCDSEHMTIPHSKSISKMIEKALKNSTVDKDDIDYISAHGTGTFSNDKEECVALKEVFAGCIKKILISSIKSMLGHTMGAASALEAIACCLAIKHWVIPPTINYETPDSECDIDCVPNKSKNKKLDIVLNNSLAFGGNNACLVLGGYEQ